MSSEDFFYENGEPEDENTFRKCKMCNIKKPLTGIYFRRKKTKGTFNMTCVKCLDTYKKPKSNNDTEYLHQEIKSLKKTITELKDMISELLQKS